MYAIPAQITWLLNVFAKHRKELFLVGGCVRDMLLQRDISDYDMTSNATPDEMMKILNHTSCAVIPTGLKHGTITVIKDTMRIEITTYRHDGTYENHRSPKQVSFTNTLEYDLARRDFTMNAIAYHPTIGLVDPFGGIQDIEQRNLRCVGDSSQRFQEDALRILRALRFHFVLGFTMDKDILAAIKHQASLLQYISKERIRDEFTKMLMSEHPDILTALKDVHVLPYIIAQMDTIYNLSQESLWHQYDVFTHTQVALNHTNGYCLEEKLAIVLHDLGKADTKTFDEKGHAHFYTHALVSERYAKEILKTLVYPNKIIERVCTLIHYHDYYVSANRRVLRRFLSHFDMDYELAYAILRVQYADDCAKNMEKAQEKIDTIEACVIMLKEMENEHDAIRMKELAINGNDLIALGYTGKMIGEQMKKLHQILLEDPSKNKREILLALSKK